MKVKSVVFYLVLFAAAGYIREFFFVQINVILFSKFYNSPPVLPTPYIMRPFTHLAYETLYYSKYLFTVLSVVAFYLLNRLALKKMSGSAVILKTLNWSYILISLMAVISMAYGVLINKRVDDDEYTLSRWFMGIVQSPLICLILLASQKLFTSNNSAP